MGPGDHLDVKKSRGIERFMAGTFILIMTAAFYATAEYKGGLPVLPVGIRYAADVLVIGMGALWIMVTVDMPKIRFLYSISVVMMVPVMGIGPVSYTHLDVYKRQGVYRGRKGSRDMVKAGGAARPWKRGAKGMVLL